jgi:hypothetical protein
MFMGLHLSLHVTHEGRELGAHTFDADDLKTIKIGRLKSAQILLEAEGVARIHAVIELGETEASVVDMGSTLGTHVNGERVHKRTLLSGDTITIGETQIAVSLGEPNVATASVQQSVDLSGTQGAALVGVASTASAAGGLGNPATGEMGSANFRAAPMMEAFTSQNEARDTGKRATRDIAFAAAVQERPHPLLAPEPPLAAETRILEIRMFWGQVLLRVEHFRKSKKVTIGEVKDTDFFIASEGLPEEVFPLVRFDNEEYILTFTKQMEGEVEIEGTAYPLETLRGSPQAQRDLKMEDSYGIKLDVEMRAMIHWGGATFALRFVPPTKPPVSDWYRHLDLAYLNVFVCSLFLHIGFLSTVLLYPTETKTLKFDLFDEDAGRFAELVMTPPKENKAAEKLLQNLRDKLPKPKQNDLKVAKQNNSNSSGARVTKSVAQKKAEIKQKFAKLFQGGGAAGSGGLLGGSGGSLAGSLSGVIGTAGAASAAGGLAGLNIRGKGPMTGGLGGSRGVGGGIGTLGVSGSGGLGYGRGLGLGKIKKKRQMISLETPVVMGALAKELIQKVINRNKAQIRYCYETELQRNQNLEGRIAMSWIIGGNGSVMKVSVRESTMGAPAVERCIAGKIKHWKFPQPSGGGQVQVNYPFVLRAG